MLLSTGKDMPFTIGQLVIHQPSIDELSFLGDRGFLIGARLLNIHKDLVRTEDNSSLSQMTNFEIFMMIMKNDNPSFRELKENGRWLLTLLFPEYQINYLPDRMLFIKPIEDGEMETGFLDKDNFEEFQNYIYEIFCLAKLFGAESGVYDPGNDRARALAEKFEAKRKMIAEQKAKEGKATPSIFENMLSVLSVGLHLSYDQLIRYTVFQLLSLYNRFISKLDYDSWFEIQLAGGTKDKQKPPESWLK